MIVFSYSYGNADGSNADLWLVKTDVNGNEQWNKTYGEKNQDDKSWAMGTTNDEGHIIVAVKDYDQVSSPRGQLWLFKTDSNGNIEWNKIYGGAWEDRGYYVSPTSDGGFIIAGKTESHSSGGDSDGWLIKIPPFDNHRPDKPDKPSGPAKGKPDTEYIFTAIASDSDGDSLSYMWDWGDETYSEWIGPYSSGETIEARHTWTSEANFEIRVMTMDEHGGESYKFICG